MNGYSNHVNKFVVYKQLKQAQQSLRNLCRSLPKLNKRGRKEIKLREEITLSEKKETIEKRVRDREKMGQIRKKKEKGGR